jgi:hypothetical protein
MDPHATSLFRASIVAHTRFVEDLVAEQAARAVGQYITSERPEHFRPASGRLLYEAAVAAADERASRCTDRFSVRCDLFCNWRLSARC